MAKILLAEGAAAPTPSTGYGSVYLSTTPELFLKDDAGLEIKPPYRQGADVASAATLNLDTATGDIVDVTGTTTITAITLTQGKQCAVRFTGALVLTHGASLVLPNAAANITTAAGDVAIFRGYASGVVRCIVYQRLNGNPLQGSAAATQAEMETASSLSVQVTPGRQHFHPGHPKCWAYVTVSGGTPTLAANYNITSITDTGVGILSITIATDFSSANWASPTNIQLVGTDIDTFINRLHATSTKTTGSIFMHCWEPGTAYRDPTAWDFMGLGDQ